MNEYSKLREKLEVVQQDFESELTKIKRDITYIETTDQSLSRLPGLKEALIETRRNLIKLKVMMEDL